MTDTVTTSPNRRNEFLRTAGKRIRTGLSPCPGWLASPDEMELIASTTSTIQTAPIIYEQIEELKTVFGPLHGKWSSYINVTPCLLEENLTFSEISEDVLPDDWQETDDGRNVSTALKEAVDRTINLAEEFAVYKIDKPRIETDPENDADWWVTVPIWCKGTVEEVFAVYQDIMQRFVTAISPSERKNIRIDLRIHK